MGLISRVSSRTYRIHQKMLIPEEDFTRIESFAKLAVHDPSLESSTKNEEFDNPEFSFLTKETSPAHKYYIEYLSRLKKITEADKILNQQTKNLDEKSVNIRRKCLIKAEIRRIDFSSSAQEKIDQIFTSITSKATKDTIVKARYDLEKLDYSVSRCRDLFSYCNMKLFSEKLLEPDKNKILRARLHFLYLLNEIVAKGRKTVMDGLMATRGNEPCNLHVALSLYFEMAETKSDRNKVLDIIDVWKEERFIPTQAIQIFYQTDREWSSIVSNWLMYTENQLSDNRRDRLELDNLGKKFLRKGAVDNPLVQRGESRSSHYSGKNSDRSRSRSDSYRSSNYSRTNSHRSISPKASIRSHRTRSRSRTPEKQRQNFRRSRSNSLEAPKLTQNQDDADYNPKEDKFYDSDDERFTSESKKKVAIFRKKFLKKIAP